MSEFNLSKEIIALSNSDTWDRAKQEWHLEAIYHLDGDPETCLCGHHPIIEMCILRNSHNNNEAAVGNVCVKKFMGLPSDRIFQCFKRIKQDNTKGLNIETIDYAYEKGWMNAWEKGFSADTMRKRSLSDKQLACRIKINNKIVRGTSR